MPKTSLTKPKQKNAIDVIHIPKDSTNLKLTRSPIIPLKYRPIAIENVKIVSNVPRKTSASFVESNKWRLFHLSYGSKKQLWFQKGLGHEIFGDEVSSFCNGSLILLNAFRHAEINAKLKNVNINVIIWCQVHDLNAFSIFTSVRSPWKRQISENNRIRRTG